LGEPESEGSDTWRLASVATFAGLIILLGGTAAAAQSQPWSAPPAASAGGPAASTPARQDAKSALPGRRPSIIVLAPKAGATVRGSRVRVSIAVRRFKVVNKQFQPPVANEGHVHFYLDVKTVPKTHTYPSPVHYHSISGTTYTWIGVSPGRHTVAAQLVGNDHVPLRPAAVDRATITVRY
jgi:hypothetical protein